MFFDSRYLRFLYNDRHDASSVVKVFSQSEDALSTELGEVVQSLSRRMIEMDYSVQLESKLPHPKQLLKEALKLAALRNRKQANPVLLRTAYQALGLFVPDEQLQGLEHLRGLTPEQLWLRDRFEVHRLERIATDAMNEVKRLDAEWTEFVGYGSFP